MHYVTVYFFLHLFLSVLFSQINVYTHLISFFYAGLRRFLFNHFLFLLRYTFLAVVQSVSFSIYLYQTIFISFSIFYPSTIQLSISFFFRSFCRSASVVGSVFFCRCLCRLNPSPLSSFILLSSLASLHLQRFTRLLNLNKQRCGLAHFIYTRLGKVSLDSVRAL